MRLFVAALLPPDVVVALDALDRPARDGVRWTTREQWHVTLRFLGDVADPSPVEVALRDAVLPPARALLGPTVTALSNAILCAPVAGLDGLAAAVVEATRDLGAPPDARPFRGHVTLARAARGGARRLVGSAIASSWDVDQVALVRSHLGRAGARYEVLASF
jgi:2'-5' RNA ligase